MNSIQNFWHQFETINLALYVLRDLPKEVAKEKLDILSQALAEFHEHLGYLIKFSTPKCALFITADGNPYLFKDVELLVHYAPTLERWNITAFIQPVEDIDTYMNAEDPPFQYHGISLRVSDSYFIAFEPPHPTSAFGIQVLLKNYIVYKDHSKLREAVYVLVEHLVGEKVFANDLLFIDIGQLGSENNPGVIPLYDLGFYIVYCQNERYNK